VPLCSQFRINDGSVVFDDDFTSSLGSPAVGSRHGMKDQTIAMAEVVLMDFDGTKTIYRAKVPLPDVISNDDTDEGILVIRSYAKTDQRDEQGRTVYEERN